MAAGKVCEVCLSPDLVQEAGLLICAVCGTQSQQFIDEGYGEEEAPVGARAVRAAPRAAPIKTSGEKFDANRLKRLYCLCLQDTLFVRSGLLENRHVYVRVNYLPKPVCELQKLCEHLQVVYGLDDALFGVARRIWFATLNEKGILEPDAFERTYKLFPRQGRVRLRHLQQFDEADGVVLEEHLSIRRSALWRMLSPFRVLHVLFLGAFVMRSDLSHTDMVCLSLSGELPFFKELVTAAQRADADGSQRLDNVVKYIGMIAPKVLLQDALALSEKIHLKLPLVNAEAVLDKYCNSMQLPKEICAGAVALLDVYQAAGYQPRLNFHPWQDPYIQLMVLLVYAVRAEMLESEDSQWADLDWFDWSRKIVRAASARHPPGFEMDGVRFPDTAAMMAVARRYCPTAAVPEQLLLLQESLWKAAQADPPYDRPEPAPEGPEEESSEPELDKADRFSCLLIAAAAVTGSFPAVLKQYLIPLEQELLKIERTAVVLGLAEPFPRMLATLDVHGLISRTGAAKPKKGSDSGTGAEPANQEERSTGRDE